MNLTAIAQWSVLISALLAGNATAGLLDSPAPTFSDGGGATIVYRMGAIHFEPGAWVDTTVSCTNLSPDPARIMLEIFDEDDRLAGRIAQTTAAPGAGVTFATSADADAPGAVIVRELPPIDHGKARVSASTIKLACTATNRIRAADGTVKEAALELIKKVAY